MRRLLLVFLLIMMAVWSLRALRQGARHDDLPAERYAPVLVRTSPGLDPRDRTRREVQHALAEARVEIHQALSQASHEVREALHQAHDEVREALAEVHDEVREAVDDIPVSIVPGTRLVEAVPEPPAMPELPEHPLAEAYPTPTAPPATPSQPGFPGLVAPPQTPTLPQFAPDETRWISGQLSATEERARDDARNKLDQEVANWLELGGVPRSWKPAARLVDEMVLETRIKPVVKDFGAQYKDYATLYEAQLRVDVSAGRRGRFQHSYQQQLVHGRLLLLGGALAFLLTCLAGLSGYIRADEATRGYYTNRLRVLAAAGVGAAGVVIYRMLV